MMKYIATYKKTIRPAHLGPGVQHEGIYKEEHFIFYVNDGKTAIDHALKFEHEYGKLRLVEQLTTIYDKPAGNKNAKIDLRNN